MTPDLLQRKISSLYDSGLVIYDRGILYKIGQWLHWRQLDLNTYLAILHSDSSLGQDVTAVRGKDEGAQGRGEDLRPVHRKPRNVCHEEKAGHP